MTESAPENPTVPHPWWLTVTLAVGHALLFTLAFPPYSLWPLIVVSVAPLAWMALRSASTRLAVLVTFITQFAMWLWIGRWLTDVTAAGYPGYAVNLALYPVLFVWITRRIEAHPLLSRAPMTLVVPLLWVGLECLKGRIVWDGYPWFFIAHPMVEWPMLAQSADLFGAYFVSFLGAMVSGLVVDGLRWRAGRVAGGTFNTTAALAVFAFALNIAYGLWRLRATESLSPGPRLLVVQTNLPQDNKIGWTNDAQVRDFAEFVRLTSESVEALEAPPDLVVWPETMLPGFGLEPETIRFQESRDLFPGDQFSSGIEALQRAIGVPMLVGSPAYLGLQVVGQRYAWDSHYNAAYLVEGDLPYQRYEKYQLTPFGEVMPYISAWPWLEEKLLAIGAEGMSFTLDTSDALNRLEFDWNGSTAVISTPICFEDTVARVCRKMIWEGGAKRSGMLVNLSNDGWFGAYDGGRLQHAQIARYRCIENRVPMVRAVNTGVSVLIDSTGKVAGRIGRGRYGDGRVEGSLLAAVRLDSRITLYGMIGDAWAWMCLMMFLLLTGLTFSRTHRTN